MRQLIAILTVVLFLEASLALKLPKDFPTEREQFVPFETKQLKIDMEMLDKSHDQFMDKHYEGYEPGVSVDNPDDAPIVNMEHFVENQLYIAYKIRASIITKALNSIESDHDGSNYDDDDIKELLHEAHLKAMNKMLKCYGQIAQTVATNENSKELFGLIKLVTDSQSRLTERLESYEQRATQ